MKILRAGLLAVGIFGGSVGRAAANEGYCSDLIPMGVYLEVRDASPRIYVDFRCQKTPQRASVLDMMFFDDDEPALIDADAGALQVTPPICWLKRIGADPYFPVAGWEYGKPLRGYMMKGVCKPLERGKRYHVTVIGSGLGGARFEINGEGALHVIDDDCAPLRATKPDASTTQ
jgi:hypothetical protein